MKNNILAVDTTHGVCSVSLLMGDEVIFDITDPESNKQAERLVSIMEGAISAGGIRYDGLDAIAVNIGPGSFTGVRIGLAAVKGINLVCGVPLVAVSSLEAIAYPAGREVLVVLDANRGQVYCQLFSAELKPLTEARLASYEELADFSGGGYAITGNGCGLVEKYLKSHDIIDATAVSESLNIGFVGARKFADGDYSDLISPLYIRKPDAKVSTSKNKLYKP